MTTLASTIASAKTSDLVFLSKSNDLVTDSKWVSHFFGKPHDRVLEKIRTLHCSQEFKQTNFLAYHYEHEQNNQMYQAYQMTKDGFMFLVMGFTGKRAAEIKERYINAFNEMEKQLTKKATEVSPSLGAALNRAKILITIDGGEVVASQVIKENEGVVPFDDPQKLNNMIKLCMPEYALVRRDAFMNAFALAMA
ncbi:Rha family transcriptional regulator [Vibrio sp. SCSIO 43136]|uniref:Rha family transcriptional regulator n=1 Tax=Vibrio sp. SCSIO 43136 TaxID=2819101 RepID=UPI002075DD27|nr:Rha family transcriptional regulator [Vibrio sp. SCSIO 43136]USD64203.1 Rha family transcriptional regulator [Vibrio sp. SCSIO 43136]